MLVRPACISTDWAHLDEHALERLSAEAAVRTRIGERWTFGACAEAAVRTRAGEDKLRGSTDHRAEFLGRCPGLQKLGFRLWSLHAEVGLVVQVVAEQLIAVLHVLARVEDVVVPERVHVLAWRESNVRVEDATHQQLAVLGLELDALLGRQAGSVHLVHEVEMDLAQVDFVDTSNGASDLLITLGC